MIVSERSEKIPLIEMFGPVLQGEGQLAGRPTWFVRTGACDYRCILCDSMHAVDPKEIARRGTVMSAKAIAEITLKDMTTRRCKGQLVTLSGGNPALWDLTDFVKIMHEHNIEVAIETQGTIWHDWIAECDYITVSPKGFGMLGDYTLVKSGLEQFKAFVDKIEQFCDILQPKNLCVKIPAFSSVDLFFAEDVLEITNKSDHHWQAYISVGNLDVSPANQDLSLLRATLLTAYDKLAWLVTTQHPKLQRVAILPQLHVLMYGNELRR